MLQGQRRILWALLLLACLDSARTQDLLSPVAWSALPGLVRTGPFVLDLDLDGRLDLVWGNHDVGSATAQLWVSLGSPGGGLLPPVGTSLASTPVSAPVVLESFDFDVDGRTDLLVHVGAEVRTWFGIGGGGFQIGAPIPGANATWSGAYSVHDLDANGTPDLVGPSLAPPGVGSTSVIDVWSWLGASWQLVQSTTPTVAVSANLTGDFNGDGFVDVCSVPSLAGPTANTVYLFLNPGTLAMPLQQVGPFMHPFGGKAAVADINGDGRDDLVTMESSIGVVGTAVSLGLPGGGLQSPLVTSPGGLLYTNLASRIHVADMDADGKDDLVLLDQSFLGQASWIPHLDVRFGRETGRVSSPMTVSLGGSSPLSAYPDVASVDVEGDGDDDLILMRSGPVSAMPAAELGVLVNRSILGRGVAGLTIPRIEAGTAALGNASFEIRLENALPGSSAVLALSRDTALIGANQGGFWVSPAPGALLLPSGSVGFVTTDSQGVAALALPVPNDPGLRGLTLYAQWVVADPGGGFGANGLSFALTDARTLVPW